MPIELKNVSFAYQGKYLANENLNLLINDGERVAIVGQNGAGKTTAVKLMTPSRRDGVSAAEVGSSHIILARDTSRIRHMFSQSGAVSDAST